MSYDASRDPNAPAIPEAVIENEVDWDALAAPFLAGDVEAYERELERQVRKAEEALDANDTSYDDIEWFIEGRMP